MFFAPSRNLSVPVSAGACSVGKMMRSRREAIRLCPATCCVDGGSKEASAEVEEVVAASTLPLSTAPGASGKASIAVCDAACANAIWVPTTEKASARNNMDGRTVNDFERHLLRKRNNLEVSRKVDRKEGPHREARDTRELTDAIETQQVAPATCLKPAIWCRYHIGTILRIPAIAVDHAFSSSA
jgi:hypothetical protein